MQAFDNITAVVEVISVAVDRLEAAFNAGSIRVYIVLACTVCLKRAAIRRCGGSCTGSAKLDRTGFLEAPVGPCRVIKVFGMRVEDRGSAVIAAYADRRVIIDAVSVPVKIDRISLDEVSVIRV